MVFSLLLYKLLHHLGFSLLLGGMVTSLLIAWREKGDPDADRGAFIAAHLVAAPGLFLVILTGLMQSYMHQWAEFKGAGYMHAKIMLALAIVICLAIEIRGQGVMRRDLANGPTINIQEKWLSLRKMATAAGSLLILCVYYLIVFRPF